MFTKPKLPTQINAKHPKCFVLGALRIFMLKRKVYCETYVVADKCSINDINTPTGRVKFSPLHIRLKNDCVLVSLTPFSR